MSFNINDIENIAKNLLDSSGLSSMADSVYGTYNKFINPETNILGKNIRNFFKPNSGSNRIKKSTFPILNVFRDISNRVPSTKTKPKSSKVTNYANMIDNRGKSGVESPYSLLSGVFKKRNLSLQEQLSKLTTLPVFNPQDSYAKANSALSSMNLSGFDPMVAEAIRIGTYKRFLNADRAAYQNRLQSITQQSNSIRGAISNNNATSSNLFRILNNKKNNTKSNVKGTKNLSAYANIFKTISANQGMNAGQKNAIIKQLLAHFNLNVPTINRINPNKVNIKKIKGIENLLYNSNLNPG